MYCPYRAAPSWHREAEVGLPSNSFVARGARRRDVGTPRPFLDILNRLEQLGVVPDKERWQLHRNLRNNLAHDYPESIEQTVATLNQLFDTWRDLEQLFEAARAAYGSRA